MKRILFAAMLWASVASANSDPAALEASGNRHFELAEYTAAIADFKEAFRITDRPELLFNIAQAYRLAGDCLQARTFYKNYLRRMPDAQNADRVRTRIDELAACAEKAAQPTTPTTPAITPTTPPVIPPTTPTVQQPVTPPAPEQHRGWMTKAGIAGLAGGALGVGIGVAFAVRSASKEDELRDACKTSCTNERAHELDDAGRAANRNAVIGFVAGGALIAAGVTLIILDGRSSGPSVAADSRGATVAWAWRY